MQKLRLFWSIVKRCQLDKFVITFIVCFFAGAAIIAGVEPGITTYREAVWYAFVSCTSIGFGDYVAITPIGRIITIVLTVMEIIMIAMLSGVVVSHYLEVVHRREQETVTMFLDKLTHLTELSGDELKSLETELKEKIK